MHALTHSLTHRLIDSLARSLAQSGKHTVTHAAQTLWHAGRHTHTPARTAHTTRTRAHAHTHTEHPTYKILLFLSPPSLYLSLTLLPSLIQSYRQRALYDFQERDKNAVHSTRVSYSAQAPNLKRLRTWYILYIIYMLYIHRIVF